jgi:hypothetical protein
VACFLFHVVSFTAVYSLFNNFIFFPFNGTRSVTIGARACLARPCPKCRVTDCNILTSSAFSTKVRTLPVVYSIYDVLVEPERRRLTLLGTVPGTNADSRLPTIVRIEKTAFSADSASSFFLPPPDGLISKTTLIQSTDIVSACAGLKSCSAFIKL